MPALRRYTESLHYNSMLHDALGRLLLRIPGMPSTASDPQKPSIGRAVFDHSDRFEAKRERDYHIVLLRGSSLVARCTYYGSGVGL